METKKKKMLFFFNFIICDSNWFRTIFLDFFMFIRHSNSIYYGVTHIEMKNLFCLFFFYWKCSENYFMFFFLFWNFVCVEKVKWKSLQNSNLIMWFWTGSYLFRMWLCFPDKGEYQNEKKRFSMTNNFFLKL